MNNSKVLVISPTLNEADNIEEHLMGLLASGYNVLIIDDNSQDNTPEIVKKNEYFDNSLFMIERVDKTGLGSAYIDGFNWGLKRNYDYLVEMDADLSHSISDLNLMMNNVEGYDLIIGSRYIPKGSTIGWSNSRRLLSKYANYLSKIILKSSVNDLTSGFRIYKSKNIKDTEFFNSPCEGYSFQVDMTVRAEHAKLMIKEVPISFKERKSGKSKMNKKIIIEAAFYLFKSFFRSNHNN